MPTIVDRETDARFWAQTGYKPNQKLDPHDPQDAKMVPVWLDIQKKVQAEYDAGKLVTTFDHPVVAQNLAEAHAADQAATAHLDAATKTPDQATAQQHVHAAHAALQLGKVKVENAAAAQPPTVSPQLTHEASHAAAAAPPPPSAPASEHVANVQAQASHKGKARGLLDKETDARFWAQAHYKPGQRLDPKDPTDAKMIPLWRDIYRKVKDEYDAGKLVLTYNHPVVAQNLADAEVADKVAAMHLDAAASSTDPHAAQQNAAAAATAAQVSAEKTREAAAAQPPTVSPTLAKEASKKASAEHHPSPAGRDQLAQVQARGAAGRATEVHRHRHGRPRSTVSAQKIREHRSRAAQAARATGAPYVLVIERPDGTLDFRPFTTRAELEAEYAKIAELHDQYAYLAAFDVAASPGAPVVDSVGIAAAEHAEVPPLGPPPDHEGGRRRERGHGRRGSGDHRGHYGRGGRGEPLAPTEAAAPPPGGAPSEAAPSEAAAPEGAAPEAPPPSPEEKPKSSVGKIVAIVAAVAAGGGLLYAVTRKSSRGSSAGHTRTRTRTPKVIVATPTTSSAARVAPGLPVRALGA